MCEKYFDFLKYPRLYALNIRAKSYQQRTSISFSFNWKNWSVCKDNLRHLEIHCTHLLRLSNAHGPATGKFGNQVEEETWYEME